MKSSNIFALKNEIDIYLPLKKEKAKMPSAKSASNANRPKVTNSKDKGIRSSFLFQDSLK